MKKLTPELIEKLKQKALAATPTGLGWETENCSIFASDIVQWGKRPGDGSTSDGYLGGVKAQRSSNAFVTVCACWTDEDAAFIAAADPETVMALIGALEVERAAVEVLAEIAERCQADSRGCEFCYVRGGCDPDNMAKCARAEARKRLGLGEVCTPVALSIKVRDGEQTDERR